MGIESTTTHPVEIVLHPSWWNQHAGITFDEDFFCHPAKRVESERRMETVLYERFGKHGLGADHNQDLPQVGPVHNAAGYLLSEMLGCEIRYHADSAPDVIPANADRLDSDVEFDVCPVLPPGVSARIRLIDLGHGRTGQSQH